MKQNKNINGISGKDYKHLSLDELKELYLGEWHNSIDDLQEVYKFAPERKAKTFLLDFLKKETSEKEFKKLQKQTISEIVKFIKDEFDKFDIEEFFKICIPTKLKEWFVKFYFPKRYDNKIKDTTLQELELQLLDEESPLKITIETFANIVKQYNSLKQNPKYKDVILIFTDSEVSKAKLCSICEKDAEIAGKILKVKPTKLGLIFHRYYLEEYLSKLTHAGYRVGIVEEKKGLKGVDNWSVTELDGINFDDNKKNPIYYFVPSLNNAIFVGDWNAKAYNELCLIQKYIKNGIIRYERLAQERFGGENETDRIRRTIILLLGGSRSTSTTFRAGGSRVSGSTNEDERIIKAFAEYKNIWFKNAENFVINNLGGKYYAQGKEARVYLSKNQNVIYKIKNVVSQYESQKSPDLLKFFDELTNHNLLFPETKYEILGFGLDKNKRFCTILKQDTIKGKPATLKEIEKYFTEDNFKKINQYAYQKGNFIVSDLKPSNVVYNNGKCYVIDCFAQNLFDFDDNFYINQTINDLGSVVSEPTKQTFYENLYQQLESIVKDDSFEKNGIRNFILSHIPEDYKNDDIEGIVEVFYQRLRALKCGGKGLGAIKVPYIDEKQLITINRALDNYLFAEYVDFNEVWYKHNFIRIVGKTKFTTSDGREYYYFGISFDAKGLDKKTTKRYINGITFIINYLLNVEFPKSYNACTQITDTLYSLCTLVISKELGLPYFTKLLSEYIYAVISYFGEKEFDVLNINIEKGIKKQELQISDLVSYKGFEETIFQIVGFKGNNYIVIELGDRTRTKNEIPFTDKDKLQRAVSPLLIEEIKFVNNNNSLSGIVQPFYLDHDTDDYLNDYSESKTATQAFLNDVKKFAKRLKKDLKLEDYRYKGKNHTINVNANEISIKFIVPYAEKPNNYLHIVFCTNHLLWQYKGLKGINYDYDIKDYFAISLGPEFSFGQTFHFSIRLDYEDILKELKYKFHVFRNDYLQQEYSLLLTKEMELIF